MNDSAKIYKGFQAHNLGFLDGKAGDPQEREFATQLERDEYQRGLDEAREAYGTGNA